jgi:hypothetical protein
VPDRPDVDGTVAGIEGLLQQLGDADPHLRQLAEEAIRLLMQLYGAGLARGIEMLGREQAVRLSEDRLVGSLLLLHGLHPVEATERIEKALWNVERRLDGHRVYVAGVTDGVARIRVEPGGGTVPSALGSAIERAVANAAPEITAVEIEGLPQAGTALVQISPAASY